MTWVISTRTGRKGSPSNSRLRQHHPVASPDRYWMDEGGAAFLRIRGGRKSMEVPHLRRLDQQL